MRPAVSYCRAVAGAEPAAVVALLAERHAAEMGADLDHDQPGFLALAQRGWRRSPARWPAGWRCGRAGRAARRADRLGLGRSPSSVRLRMNTGLPRHLTVSDMPGSTEEMSTSIGASARAAASGFIWSMSGQTVERRADRADGAGGDVEEIAPGRLGMVGRCRYWPSRSPRNAPRRRGRQNPRPSRGMFSQRLGTCPVYPGGIAHDCRGGRFRADRAGVLASRRPPRQPRLSAGRGAPPARCAMRRRSPRSASALDVEEAAGLAVPQDGIEPAACAAARRGCRSRRCGPWSSTTSRSIAAMVDRRWAMAITVLPAISR